MDTRDVRPMQRQVRKGVRGCGDDTTRAVTRKRRPPAHGPLPVNRNGAGPGSDAVVER